VVGQFEALKNTLPSIAMFIWLGLGGLRLLAVTGLVCLGFDTAGSRVERRFLEFRGVNRWFFKVIGTAGTAENSHE
jgi:hypothetical protein